MKWTHRGTVALAAASCLTALCAAAVDAAHMRNHHRYSRNRRAVHKTHIPQTTVSHAPKFSADIRMAGNIDRASHSREPLTSTFAVAPVSRGENIARTALAYRGVPYRFGGRSAQSGFDCSGLVQTVCAKWGIYLPRVAGAQYGRGVPVKPWDLRPGDLVFFQGTYKRGLSHVGIFIGNGQFVHAAGRGKGVRISNLADSYNQRHWAGARRVDLSRLPKMKDEMPVLASEIIVDQPGQPVAPSGQANTSAAQQSSSVQTPTGTTTGASRADTQMTDAAAQTGPSREPGVRVR